MEPQHLIERSTQSELYWWVKLLWRSQGTQQRELFRYLCVHQSVIRISSDSLRSRTSAKKGKRGGGGALSSTCNAVGEIFKIAAIMNGLVLVGVAVGFVLLRIEAAVEENE
ncbi:hypothetical protein QJS10_CPB17g02551 [Acorus calamus]|uniref:Cytochrome b6-f complex subunit 7 n=1 Tax=Acorus calamus TaxID=4465 RepID=A0AAV9CSH9_ACOCL|nr:hypothetical protein QJS10_CPB17g02551 [Acorus calamus]